MTKSAMRVAVTGGAGNIAYSVLFRIAAGEMLGKDQPIILNILEVPGALKALEGVKMELEDCAFPLLKEVNISSDANDMFEAVELALLIGAKPRTKGMERSELLEENGKIFIHQGKALNDSANKNVKVLVVGNPCNTNALIALQNAKNLNPKNFFAMTMLDQNRAKAQLALKANVSVKDVSNTVIWGNHSLTQVPDFYHAKIQGESALKYISDEAWLKGEFISTVQKRGAAIIDARGSSSAASAANAIIDTVKALKNPTLHSDCFSVACFSNGNPYEIEENLIFSFPCVSKGDFNIEIVKGFSWNDFLTEKIKATEKELIDEREMALKATV